MKIVDVKARIFAVPPRRMETEVPWVFGRLAQVFVEVTTDDGLVGIGEAYAYGVPKASAAVVNETLRPLLVGEDARRIAQLTQRMFQKTHLFGRYGVTTFAISGVEMALWDLAGKRAGQPLYQLLGGAAGTRVPAYASLVRYPEEHEQIRLDAEKAMAEGFTMLKVHQITVPSVAMAREVIGEDVPLTVDINCEWSPFEAARMAEAMHEYELFWLEEPVWPPEDYLGLAQVQASTGVPLSSGENACTAHQFKAMMDAGAVTYLQPSVTKVGGIAEWLNVARLVQLNGFELAPHSPYFGPGLAATLHLIAHTGQGRWIEKIYFDLEVELFKEPLQLAGGVYTVPDGPGLGVELNWEALAAFEVADG
ncbi:MAG: mandelate racemase/muconate lactonizing enzyme family protein [SAR324 cluster bacterium]|nr:mandelate racemase/muconate lactonizing enzyme family protein [SAR324 cluster bacterium]